MIRLNDIYKTVIDEKEINGYGKNDDSTGINLIISSKAVFAEYNSYKTRDKDIELLDKLFDVEYIEDKVEERVEEEKTSYPSEEPQVSEPTEEKYLTWKVVKQYATKIQVKLPNGETYRVFYDIDYARIRFYSPCGDNFNGAIYDEDLFDSLRLKEVK